MAVTGRAAYRIVTGGHGDMKDSFVAKLGAGIGTLERIYRAKRESIADIVVEIRSSGRERLDILKMGVESAWIELRVAFETATALPGAEAPQSRERPTVNERVA